MTAFPKLIWSQSTFVYLKYQQNISLYSYGIENSGIVYVEVVTICIHKFTRIWFALLNTSHKYASNMNQQSLAICNAYVLSIQWEDCFAAFCQSFRLSVSLDNLVSIFNVSWYFAFLLIRVSVTKPM
jgi:hypothetical protein